MRTLLAALAVLALCGCARDMYTVGAGSTGPLTHEPDPFELLGPGVPIGVRLDLASARATPSGPEFDEYMRRFVRSGAPGPGELGRAVLDRTDLAVLGLNPGRGNEADEVLILRGRFDDLDIAARWAEDEPLTPTEYRQQTVFRTEDFALAILDQRLVVLGDLALVLEAIGHVLDRTRPVPGTPAVAAPWDLEDAQLLVVVLPNDRILDELRRTPPYTMLAASLERVALRVHRTAQGERLELRVETSSHEDARVFADVARDEIAEVVRDPYAEVSGLSGLLRALRVAVDEGDVEVVGEATDADLRSFARRALEML